MRKFSLILAVLAFCSFGMLAQAAPAAGSQPSGLTVPSSQSAQDGYILGAGDKISILVYDEPNLSGEQIVGPDGTVTVALIGPVPAAGRTAFDLTTDIRLRLANGFIRNPSVTVNLVSYRPFYILGEVNRPGQYDYVKGMSVFAAIAKAEGFTYRARKNYVFLKREGADHEDKVNLTSDLLVQPGDTIRVGERHF
ncbi:polysaccharide export protein [Novosphingobium sp. NBM11]|uniref:polysaccharide biosynthesis/export family protein n=1 Tax=Novosphingobium sp. NBM11 TaxID=2596914 RepID=UPI0018920CC5|nr:polysaccharide biosynthesis/export family protein [Novosphingobium sp. NBM11]MBF5091541.1 polysaccharide export protein [Novosphingobium sp. NBM11]